ncbi:MAG: hypothetical protein ACREHG_00840, partial [Candidatus Saccharimonadales bacterium]
MSLLEEFNMLMRQHWNFLYKDWPQLQSTKYHRTEVKDINDISHVKEVILQRLGHIPVFFFLTVLFSTECYPGPYHNVDKGLLILYQLLKNCSTNEMTRFQPKSSFYAIYRAFYIKQYKELDKKISTMLATMFSNINLRILSAQEKNPPLFKHITLLLDGHDTRVSPLDGMDSKQMYSYKFKKSGLRTQVIIDMNEMVLWTSKSAPCKENSDGVMFTKMNLEKNMHELDCVG